MTNITFRKDGNIFNEESEAIVNPVNCFGVMGAGLANSFKKKFPNNFKHYRETCLKKKLVIGSVFIFNENNRIIINLPTKKHWKDSSRIDYIDNGIDAMVNAIKEHNIKSVSLPAIGCGLGGLKWGTVRKLLINKLMTVDECDFIVFEPH